MKIYACQKNINKSTDKVFFWIKTIGGDNGYYYVNWLWRFRGFIDKILGGIGFRKGRRDKLSLKVGDKLDFWRVEEYIENEKLTLRAEFEIFGEGWMEFIVIEIEDGSTLLNLKVKFIPNSWIGQIYWYFVYPLHKFVFIGLLRQIKKRSEVYEC